MNLNHALAQSPRRRFKPQDMRSTNPKAVLKDLFELLEEFGPVWYTEELHTRVRIALSDLQ